MFCYCSSLFFSRQKKVQLDGKHGLPVYVITQPITCKIIVAVKNSSDMEKFLVDFTNSMIDEKNNRLNTFSWYLLYVVQFYSLTFRAR